MKVKEFQEILHLMEQYQISYQQAYQFWAASNRVFSYEKDLKNSKHYQAFQNLENAILQLDAIYAKTFSSMWEPDED